MRTTPVQTTEPITVDLSEITLGSYLKYIEQEYNVTIANIANITPSSAEICFTGDEENVGQLLFRELNVSDEDLEATLGALEDKEPPLWTAFTFHDALLRDEWDYTTGETGPYYARPRVYVKTVNGKTYTLTVSSPEIEPIIVVTILDEEGTTTKKDFYPLTNGKRHMSTATSSAQFRQVLRYVDSMMEA